MSSSVGNPILGLTTRDKSNIQHKYPLPKLSGMLYLIGGKADVPQLQNGSQDSPGGAELILREADSLQSLHQDQKILTVLLPQDITRSALREKEQIMVISPFSPRVKPSSRIFRAVQCFKAWRNVKR